MKRYFLLSILLLGLSVSLAFADGKGGDKEDELLRKSSFTEPNPFVENTSFPRVFNELNNPVTSPQISTGYYYVDSDEEVGAFWRPNYPSLFQDTTFQPNTWTRVVAGPRILPQSFWNTQDGYHFFRNPNDLNFWSNPTDTTDDAIAGPIPLGLNGGFYFNGIRYDSFYVSTNGLISLTNRRYFYDENGNRTIPSGSKTAYDPMSMDWFLGGLREKDYERDNNGNFIFVNGFRVLKNGLTDPVRDDFGYWHAILGNDPFYNPESGNPPPIPGPQGGIRSRGNININNAINQNNKTAVIAPFWGDLHLSQWDEEKERVDDYGKVYFKRNIERNELRVSFYRIAPKGNLATPYGNYNGEANLRGFRPDEPGGDFGYVSADGQVLLDTKDSSITILYRAFNGQSPTFRPAFGNQVFRCNTTAGVRGFARHINFNRGGVSENNPLYPWAAEYPQYTHYFSRFCTPDQDWPNSSQAIKFKQWQNTLRVADIRYRVRELDNEASLDFTVTIPSAQVDNYEMLAGEERLGAIQPIALIQNLSNDIQGPRGFGVNYVTQDLEFRARFVIENQITGQQFYNRLVPVDAFCMGLDDGEFQECNGDESLRIRYASAVAKDGSGNYTATLMSGPEYKSTGFDGVPPYKFVEIAFPAWEANEFLDNHIGRHRAFIIAVPQAPRTGDGIGDQWPFDDTTSVRLFTMRRLTEFADDVSEFHVDRETNVTIPHALKWVNIDAEVISGEAASRHPLPPRGNFGALNVPTRRVFSPVIKMNRVQIDGLSEPLPRYEDDRGFNGDELRSFPIDMRGKFGAVLSLSVQRNIDKNDWVRGWSDSELVGPEPRVIANGNPFNVYNAGTAASRNPDELVVEFAKPSDDGLTEITNIPLENWRHHPGRRGTDSDLIEDVAALTIYGAGGYSIGFLESDKDSALAVPNAGQFAFNSLRQNTFDDGIDWEYKKYFVQIPDTFINWRRAGAESFRFRLKVLATNDLKNPIIPSLPDDDDDFLVDNVSITIPSEVTDLEISAVKLVWPYTLAPASQADKVPIRVTVSNNTSLDAPAFSIKTSIYRITGTGNNIVVDSTNKIYCRFQAVNNLTANTTLEVDIPFWNVRKSQVEQEASYRIVSEIKLANNERDLIPSNDLTYKDVTMTFSDVFAYDPNAEEPINSVQAEGSPANMPGGRGMTLFGSNWGGPNFNLVDDRAGAATGNGSGQIAVKFTLSNTDTLRGYRALFGNLNFAPDFITLSVYDNGGRVPGQEVIAGTQILRRRLIDDITNQITAGAYVTYLLENPVELAPGTYWISIAQMAQNGLELGGSASRSGMRVTNRYISPAGVLGEQGNNLILDKNFRRMTPQGNYVNDNYFAFENTQFSGNWREFTPSIGNPAYPHLDHNGLVPVTDQTLSNGTFIPMFRPYFGYRNHGQQADEQQWCPDDEVPVELMSFDGEVRKSGIDLIWETASEENNSGFIIERKIYNDSQDFEEIAFVSAADNPKVINRYNFTDREVAHGSTYQYRLKQIDIDGTINCNVSQVVTKTFLFDGLVTLEQNSPNPANSSTTFNFTLEQESDARLEVLDIYGNVIAVVAEGAMSAGPHSVNWNVTADNGAEVPSGTYIYRLIAGENTLTGKLTVVK